MDTPVKKANLDNFFIRGSKQAVDDALFQLAIKHALSFASVDSYEMKNVLEKCYAGY